MENDLTETSWRNCGERSGREAVEKGLAEFPENDLAVSSFLGFYRPVNRMGSPQDEGLWSIE